MKDSNGILIHVGQTVLVPYPNDSDNHNHEFFGYVSGFRGENVTVIDGDSNAYDIEPERLTIQD